jgi:hypothetical protein
MANRTSSDSAKSCAKSVVAWFYAVLLLVTGFLKVDGLYCFESGSLSKWSPSCGYVAAALLVGNRQLATFAFA